MEEPVTQGCLARLGPGPVMLVKAIGGEFAYCVWFDERAAVCHGTFRTASLTNVDRQCRATAVIGTFYGTLPPRDG